MRRRRAVAFLAGAMVLAGPCSSNSSQVQDKIASDIRSETGVQNAKVTCPSDVKASKGETFTCDATGDFSAYLQKNGVNAQLNHLKFTVTFVQDSSFSADLDQTALQADLASQNPGATSSASSSTPSLSS